MNNRGQSLKRLWARFEGIEERGGIASTKIEGTSGEGLKEY